MQSLTHRTAILATFAGLLMAAAPAAAQQPLSAAFTYQGQLAAAGTPATGTYDIRFRLYDAPTAGNQLGSTLCSDNLAVTAGSFGAALDFGSVFTGQKRFLELEVRPDTGLNCSDGSGYTLLSPRQELTAAPNATFALTAATATSASNALTLGGQPAGYFTSASNLTGTLPAASLPGTVARTDVNQTFTGLMNFSNAGNLFTGIFTGSGAGLTNINGANIAAGTITRSGLAGDVQRVLSQWTPTSVPVDAAAWGNASAGQTSVPALPAGLTYTAVAAGGSHSLALRSNGTAVAWGSNSAGLLNVPALPAGVTYTAVAGGISHSLALRSDGTVAAWGDNGSGQLSVPAGVTYTAVAGGGAHSLALRSDGTAAAWGFNNAGQTNVPALPAGVTYTAVAAGTFHSLGLRSNGTVIVWGSSADGLLNVPALPAGVTYTAVASGANHCLALRSNGTLAAWGFNSNGEINVPALPAGAAYTAVAGGGNHSLAVRSDGAVVAWGKSTDGQINVPALPAGLAYTAVACGLNHSIALRSSTISVAANPIVGSGAALTNLSAANLTGTVSQSVLPVASWINSALPVTSISSTTFTTMNGTSRTIATRPGFAVINWTISGRGTIVGGAYLFRVKADTAGTSTFGPESIFIFNQGEVHTTISGNAVVAIPAGGETTYTLEVRKSSGSGAFNYDFNDSLTGTIINIGQ